MEIKRKRHLFDTGTLGTAESPGSLGTHISERTEAGIGKKQDWLLNCFQGQCHQRLKIL